MMRIIIQIGENPTGTKTLRAFLLKDQEVETLMVMEMEEMMETIEMTVEKRKPLANLNPEILVAMMMNQEEDEEMIAP